MWRWPLPEWTLARAFDAPKRGKPCTLVAVSLPRLPLPRDPSLHDSRALPHRYTQYPRPKYSQPLRYWPPCGAPPLPFPSACRSPSAGPTRRRDGLVRSFARRSRLRRTRAASSGVRASRSGGRSAGGAALDGARRGLCGSMVSRRARWCWSRCLLRARRPRRSALSARRRSLSCAWDMSWGDARGAEDRERARSDRRRIQHARVRLCPGSALIARWLAARGMVSCGLSTRLDRKVRSRAHRRQRLQEREGARHVSTTDVAQRRRPTCTHQSLGSARAVDGEVSPEGARGETTRGTDQFVRLLQQVVRLLAVAVRVLPQRFDCALCSRILRGQQRGFLGWRFSDCGMQRCVIQRDTISIRLEQGIHAPSAALMVLRRSMHAARRHAKSRLGSQASSSQTAQEAVNWYRSP